MRGATTSAARESSAKDQQLVANSAQTQISASTDAARPSRAKPKNDNRSEAEASSRTWRPPSLQQRGAETPSTDSNAAASSAANTQMAAEASYAAETQRAAHSAQSPEPCDDENAHCPPEAASSSGSSSRRGKGSEARRRLLRLQKPDTRATSATTDATIASSTTAKADISEAKAAAAG